MEGNSSKPKLLIPILLFSCLLAYTVGLIFFTKWYLTKKNISEDNLPFGLSVLQNPIVYQWRGSVKGTLTKKDSNSITITQDSKNITIPIDEKLTPFYDPKKYKLDGGIKPVTINEIPVGVYLTGEFFTTPTADNKNSIFGSSFMISDKAP